MTGILLLRPEESSKKLYNKLVEEGFDVVNIPVAKVIPITDLSVNYKRVTERYEYIVFTTQIGVKILYQKLKEDNIWDEFLRSNKDSNIISIGPQTKKTLESIGLKVKFLPPKYTTDGLIELFADFPIQASNILLVRSMHADRRLERILRERGGNVVLLYTHRLVESDKADKAVKLIMDGKVDAIVFTSSILATIVEDNLIRYGSSLSDVSKSIIIFSIGPLTSRKLREFNVDNFIEAFPHDSDGLYMAIKSFYKR